MRLLTGLGLLVALVTAARLLAAGAEIERGSEAALGLGTLLIGGYLCGGLAARLGFPKITGYIAAGFFFSPGTAVWFGYPTLILSKTSVYTLHTLDDIAIGVIAFKGGSELRWEAIRPQLRAITGILLGHAVGAGVAVAAASWFALELLGLGGLSPGESIAVSLLLGTMAIAISPATALAIRDECKASGPVSDTALSVTIMADVLVAVLFAVVAGGARLAFGAEGGHSGWLVVWELLGSLVVGVIVGWGVTQLIRAVQNERPAMLLACAAAAMIGARYLHLSGLLVALVAGAVVRNRSDLGDDLEHGLHKVSLPLYVLFFGLAGTHMDPKAVMATGWGLLIIPVARAIGIRFGTKFSGKFAGAPPVVQNRVWMGLIGQAGMTLALAAIVAQQFPAFGPRVYTLVLGVIAVHELFGPVSFRWAIRASGEAGKAETPEGAHAVQGAPAH